jgi:hypothetical protein
MYPDCTESADCFSLAGAPSSSAKSKLGPASAKQKGKGEIKRQRVSASPLREETLAKRQNEGRGGTRGGSAPSRGRDRRVKNDTDRSRVDRGIPRSVGGRCRRRNGRRTSPPRDGRSPPTIDGAAAPAEKRPRAGVPPSPRVRPSDRALESILAESRVHRRRRGVRERRSRVARVPGPSRSRPVPPASDGTAWPERKSACAITLGGRETAAARNARVERARTEVGQVVSHNKDERSGRAVRLMRAGEARASFVRRAR